MTRPPATTHRTAILALYETGLRRSDIARELGVSTTYVSDVLGPMRRYPERGGAYNPPHSEAFIARARQLWDAGGTLASVAEAMGVTRNVIAGVAHRNNFTARPSPIGRYRYTDAQCHRVAKLNEAGNNAAEISFFTGIPVNAVTHILRRHRSMTAR